MKNTIVKLFVLTMFCFGANGLQAQTVKDIDGNVYKTVKIGTQVWMTENLKTTKYKDGIAIPLVTDDKIWGTLTRPAFCWYHNDATSNRNKFGALYNWFVVNTNKLCPTGWHVASDEEWTTLTTFLGGEQIAGGKLKEKGNSQWQSPNTGATNESGFSALPSGYRIYNDTFRGDGLWGYWWTSSEKPSQANAFYRRLSYDYRDVVNSIDDKRNGWSVRCLKDQ
jgi:uncharacterized protein (TIGR02145 family)